VSDFENSRSKFNVLKSYMVDDGLTGMIGDCSQGGRARSSAHARLRGLFLICELLPRLTRPPRRLLAHLLPLSPVLSIF
jgi:hypothetical protein